MGKVFVGKLGRIGPVTPSLAKAASRGVTANAVAPGMITTELTARMNEKAREMIIAQISLGRMGTPEDVARTARFLCSPAAGFITGQIIPVNGGFRFGPRTSP